jgi:hypothetical protein
LFDARLILFRAIEPKIQFGCAADSQSLYEFVTNVLARGFQAFQTLVRFLVVSLYVHPDFGGPSVFGNMNCGYTDQPNPRIGQLTFHQRFDFLAQGFADPSTMMLQPPPLHHSTSGKTVENIRKLDARVALECATAALF